MADELAKRDAATSNWLTLRDCASEMGVTNDQVRQWCGRWRDGQPDGLPYAHAGAKPEGEAGRTLYRIHRDDWEAFKRRRRGLEQAEERRVGRLVAEPLDLVGRRGGVRC